jgi:ABC-type sugar transport system ATPase subunit
VRRLRTSERQLVALAKGLLRDPKFLILDEPTASMSQPEIHALFAIIRRLRDSGVSVLYVTHRLEEVFLIADTVTVLRDGALVRTGLTAEITRPELIGMIAGREVRVEERRRDIERGRPLLSVRKISRRPAFADISFDVHEGEVVALAGLVGAGRSEIARAIFGADALDGGTVHYPLGDNKAHDPHDAVRAGLAMLPEDRKVQGVVPKMSVGDNLMLSSVSRYADRIPGLIDFRAVGAVIAQKVAQLDIRPRGAEARAIETLSGGNQQKVLLARAMESGASVLILDEPTAGVDVGTKTEIQRLILQLAAQGKGILLISSEMDELLALATRILVIREGRMVRELVGRRASSLDVLKSALGEDERIGEDGVLPE